MIPTTHGEIGLRLIVSRVCFGVKRHRGTLLVQSTGDGNTSALDESAGAETPKLALG